MEGAHGVFLAQRLGEKAPDEISQATRPSAARQSFRL